MLPSCKDPMESHYIGHLCLLENEGSYHFQAPQLSTVHHQVHVTGYSRTRSRLHFLVPQQL